MRIGASRQKYSPWLIIHFGRTETTSPEPAIDPWSPLPVIPEEDSYGEEVILLAHFDEDISVSMANGIYSKQLSDASLYRRLFGIQWITETSLTATVTVGGSSGKFPSDLFATGYFKCTGHDDSFGEGGMIVVVPNDLGPNSNVYAQFDANTEFTMEGFVKPDGYKKAVAFGFSEKVTVTGFYVEVGMNSEGQAQAIVANEFSTQYFTLNTATTLSTNLWTHLACVREISGTISLFVNGIKESNTLLQAGLITGDLGRIVIGGQRNGTLRRKIWNGAIDEVRFTKNIARYKSNFAPITTRFQNP
jgi:hypothetical protein